MPFTYVTYNPDSRDNNLCDQRILTITNLETLKKKMFHTILLELFLLFRPFKKTANIRRTTISAQIIFKYMRTKQNGGLLLREKQARQLRTCLNKPLTAQRRSHRLIEPSTASDAMSAVS